MVINKKKQNNNYNYQCRFLQTGTPSLRNPTQKRRVIAAEVATGDGLKRHVLVGWEFCRFREHHMPSRAKFVVIMNGAVIPLLPWHGLIV